MICSACGTSLPDDARFCDRCGKTVEPTPATLPSRSSSGPSSDAQAGAPRPAPPPASSATSVASGYSTINNRPNIAQRVGAVLGVLLLVGIGVGVVMYQSSEQRRLNEMDYPSLEAEYDALQTVGGPLDALAAAAAPQTPPADYAKRLAEVRAAVEKYRASSRRATPLPSSRPWPAQFETADRQLDRTVEFYGLVATYLDLRAKVKGQKGMAAAEADQNVVNMALKGSETLDKLKQTLKALESQRTQRAWDYRPPSPKGRE